MTNEQQTSMYRDLYYTSVAINSGRSFLNDLQSTNTDERLLEHVSSQVKDFESTIKSSLYFINNKDRIDIMSYAFKGASSIKNEISLEGDNRFYEKQLDALETLIELNNQTMLFKYGLQDTDSQLESLSALPQNQLESFSQFLSKQIMKQQEETINQGAFDTQVRLEDLHSTTQLLIQETANVQ